MVKNSYKELIRFIIVGLMSTSVHIVIAISAIEVLDARPLKANLFAFISTFLFSYIMNSKWSFSSTLAFNKFYKFSIVALLNFLLIYTIVSINEVLKTPVVYSVYGIAILSPIISFLSLKFWIFSNKNSV
ncbi:GtrA family protein [Thalassotalea fonticola]|uniref:GtrA family protein n=1 Tax=Thalassotalea fonticola TaxID=3065649 RepID=UPI003866FE15